MTKIDLWIKIQKISVKCRSEENAFAVFIISLVVTCYNLRAHYCEPILHYTFAGHV